MMPCASTCTSRAASSAASLLPSSPQSSRVACCEARTAAPSPVEAGYPSDLINTPVCAAVESFEDAAQLPDDRAARGQKPPAPLGDTMIAAAPIRIR